MSVKWSISQHAVDRYIERFDPSATYWEARQRLEAGVHRAGRLTERTICGDEQWAMTDEQGTRPTAFLVVTYDPRVRRRVVKTVLPAPEGPVVIEPDLPEEAPAWGLIRNAPEWKRRAETAERALARVTHELADANTRIAQLDQAREQRKKLRWLLKTTIRPYLVERVKDDGKAMQILVALDNVQDQTE